jgi:hypothetical protein
MSQTASMLPTAYARWLRPEPGPSPELLPERACLWKSTCAYATHAALPYGHLHTLSPLSATHTGSCEGRAAQLACRPGAILDGVPQHAHSVQQRTQLACDGATVGGGGCLRSGPSHHSMDQPSRAEMPLCGAHPCTGQGAQHHLFILPHKAHTTDSSRRYHSGRPSTSMYHMYNNTPSPLCPGHTAARTATQATMLA